MDVETFYDGSTAMIRFPDGGVMRLADAQRQISPDLEFDDISGLPLASTPTPYDPSQSVSASAPNRFGDVGSTYGNESLQAAGDMLSNKVNLYDALPSSMQGGVMEPVNRTIMNAATLGAGGLMGLLGLFEKGVGYGSEIVAGGTEAEKRLARDVLGGSEVAGIGPEARALAALSSPASQQVSRAALDRLNQPGPVPTMYSNPLGGVKPKTSAAELRRQANIQRFGYDPSAVPEAPAPQGISEGFQAYLNQVNPDARRIPPENRPNLMMGDMYGMLPEGAKLVKSSDDVSYYRGPEGDYFATAYNPDVGEMDVVGYSMGGGRETDLQVVNEMQGKGIGGELQYLFRKENPNAPTGGLTEAGEKSLQKTYKRLSDEGVLSMIPAPTPSRPLNPAEQMAKGILDMRAAGRAGEVTNEMRAAADPQYMYFNTPLPMDEASRMARGVEMGKVEPAFRGTMSDEAIARLGQFVSRNPDVTQSFAGHIGFADEIGLPPELAQAEGGNIMPLLVDPSQNTSNLAGYEMNLPGNALRSRFALFDPEFKHLRNLSAGVGGMGLLGMSYPQEGQY